MIRRIGDQAVEETKRELLQAATAPMETSEKDSYELQRIRVAQSVLRNGKASSMEEALQMVDEAI